MRGLQCDVECVVNTMESRRGRDLLFVPMGTESSVLETAVHAAHPMVSGGARSRSCAAEIRSTICIAPPHLGQRSADRLADRVAVAPVLSVKACSNSRQRGSRMARRRLARKPKLRMRTKPRGADAGGIGARTRQRATSSASSCSHGGVAPAESDVPVFEDNKSAVGDGHAMVYAPR